MQVAAVVTEPGQPIAIVDDVVVDEPRSGEAMIRLTAAGVCGTDASLADGRMRYAMPLLLGHEAAGVVEELGPDTDGPAPGSRVALWMRPPCRSCRACLRGDAGLCTASGAMSARGTLMDGRTGFSRGGEAVHRALGVGAFTTRLVMPVASLVPVPDAVSDDAAALLSCGVATGAGAILNVAMPSPGDTVLIVGAGGVGLAAVMAAAAVGVGAIVVADPAPHRREAAMGLGATHAVEGGDRKAMQAQLADVLGEREVDCALDCVGRPEIVEAGMRLTRQGGTVVAVGVQPSGSSITLPGPLLTLLQKRVLGCYMGGIDPQRDLPVLYDLVVRGALPVDRLVGARRPISEVGEAIADLEAARGMRTIIDCTA